MIEKLLLNKKVYLTNNNEYAVTRLLTYEGIEYAFMININILNDIMICELIVDNENKNIEFIPLEDDNFNKILKQFKKGI